MKTSIATVSLCVAGEWCSTNNRPATRYPTLPRSDYLSGRFGLDIAPVRLAAQPGGIGTVRR